MIVGGGTFGSSVVRTHPRIFCYSLFYLHMMCMYSPFCVARVLCDRIFHAESRRTQHPKLDAERVAMDLLLLGFLRRQLLCVLLSTKQRQTPQEQRLLCLL